MTIRIKEKQQKAENPWDAPEVRPYLDVLARTPEMQGSAAPFAGSLTDSRLAALCAQTCFQAFNAHQARFDAVTRRGAERFLARDWVGARADAAERLRLYGETLAALTREVAALMAGRLTERRVWAATKAVYSSLIAGCHEWEIAETFFNSLTRRVFTTVGVDQETEFVDTDFDAPPTSALGESCRALGPASLTELLHAISKFLRTVSSACRPPLSKT